MNDEQVDTALDELDKDGDGEISFAEFEVRELVHQPSGHQHTLESVNG